MGSPSPLLLDLPAANQLAPQGFVYERRQPELGALHRAVRTGWPQVKALGSQLALGQLALGAFGLGLAHGSISNSMTILGNHVGEIHLPHEEAPTKRVLSGAKPLKSGESIAFGVGVTMPAILILGFDLELTRVALVAVLGGLLGILMMIPLRRALIVQQHGILKYPEGTACAEVLKAGTGGDATGGQAQTIFGGFAIGLLYKVAMSALKGWKDTPSVRLRWRDTRKTR